MTDEPPKVSVEDEAKQIFEAARLNLGDPNSHSAEDRTPSPIGADGDADLSEAAAELEPQGLAVLPGRPVSQPEPADNELLPEPSIDDRGYAVLGRRAPPQGSPLEPAQDERLRESRRDAFKRLQGKADDSRRSGLFE